MKFDIMTYFALMFVGIFMILFGYTYIIELDDMIFKLLLGLPMMVVGIILAVGMFIFLCDCIRTYFVERGKGWI